MQAFSIEELIPQRPPFVMVGRLISYGADGFSSSFSIDKENLFVKNGYFQEEGMIENIAQTAAAGAGYGFKINKQDVKLGYIGAVKNAIIIKRPAIGTTIRTDIKILNKVFNVDIIEGKIFNENNELLASCEMKIFID